MDIFELQRKDAGSHVFTTDHVLMNQMGLGTFTTGTLYEYFCTRSPRTRQLPGSLRGGEYTNRGIITKPNGDPIESIDDIIGNSNRGGDSWGTWEGWRKLQYTGKYELQRYDDWTLKEARVVVPYTAASLDFDKFAPSREPRGVLAEVPSLASGVYKDVEDVNTLVGFDLLNTDLDILKTTEFHRPDDGISPSYTSYLVMLSEDADFFLSPSEDPLVYPPVLQDSPNPMLNIINMNDFIRNVKQEQFRGGWKNLEEATFNKTNLFAIDEYISDIKSSKTKSIVVSGELNFNFEMADGRFQCPKTEWVTFNLYLNDAVEPTTERTSIVMKTLNLATFKRDPTGRSYLHHADGDVEQADGAGEGDKEVAELKVSYNPYEKKWESGTASLMAICATDFDSAYYNPTVEGLEGSDIAADLKDGDESKHFAPASGLVIPIFPQNENPMQWAPNYASDSQCRADDDLDKQKLIAFNFNPLKPYEAGTNVMISQIGGIWHVIDMGSGIPIKRKVDTKFAGKWQFQYFATYEDSFFRVNDVDGQVAPSFFERQYHQRYYQSDTKNLGHDYNSQFSTKYSFNPMDMTDGVWQITSWDFMDSQIFGTRGMDAKNGLNTAPPDLNALATTQAQVDAAGRSIPVGDVIRNAAHSGPFFGCVFPDGYDSDKIAGYANSGAERDFYIFYQNSGSPNENPSLPATINKAIGEAPNIGEGFFHSYADGEEFSNTAKDSFNLTGIFPFSERQYEEVAPGEEGASDEAPYAPARSDPRSATHQDPDEGDLGTDGEDHWYEWGGKFSCAIMNRVGSPKYSPSMFYQINQGTNSSLQQLPADIATNAHISDDYGGPQYSVHRCRDFYTSRAGFSSQPARDVAKEAMLSCSWLRQSKKRESKGGGKGEDIYSPEDSAFGFKPKQPSRIIFRPLKIEAYAMYNEGASATVTDPIGGGEVPIVDHYDRIPRKYLDAHGKVQRGCMGVEIRVNEGFRWENRASWSAQAHRGMKSRMSPVSPQHVKAREMRNCHGELPMIHWDQAAAYHMDYSRTYPPFSPGLRFMNSEMDHFRSYRSRIHTPHWERHGYGNFGWMRFNEYTIAGAGGDGDGEPGAGAFGVIGAVTTVVVEDNIEFITDNYFGMGSIGESRIGKCSGFSFWFGGGSCSDYKSIQRPSWGGASINDYNQNNTTHLSVTIYQGHPREDTVYDPKCFAVHHFNPRVDAEGHWTGHAPSDGANFAENWAARYDEQKVDLIGGADPESDAAWPYTSGIPFINNEGENVVLMLDLDITDTEISDNFWGLPVPAVGIREPSVFYKTGHSPLELKQGEVLFRNGWYPGGANGHAGAGFDNDFYPLLDPDFAHLNTTRVGKLLPYNYKYYAPQSPDLGTVTIGDNTKCVILSELGITNDIPITYHINKLVLLTKEGAGDKYQVGDIVGNSAKGITFGVVAVDDSGGDLMGPITALEVIDRGTNLTNHFSALPDHDAKMGKDAPVGIKLGNVSSINGVDFEAYIINFIVEKLDGVDQKPLYVERELQISANADATNRKEVVGGIATQFGFVNDQVTTKTRIDSDYKHPDGIYDLFFHFHNDVTHTWMSSSETYFSDGQNPYENDEQYIQLTIGGT